jgi:hypothetical protein
LKRGFDRRLEGVAVGQDISFLLLAVPDREFKARIDYVFGLDRSIDPPASGPRHDRQRKASSHLKCSPT